jgi:hypothetical protein
MECSSLNGGNESRRTRLDPEQVSTATFISGVGFSAFQMFNNTKFMSFENARISIGSFPGSVRHKFLKFRSMNGALGIRLLVFLLVLLSDSVFTVLGQSFEVSKAVHP